MKAEVAHYLQRHHVMTLATCGADGPWASAVFYVNIGPALYFLSSPSSRHARNLAADPRCAATVQQECSDWKQIQGVQLEGRVEQVYSDDELRARQCYGDKFPLVGRLDGAPALIVAAFAKVRWYRLRATRMHFIDNSLGFGHREAVDLEGGA